MLPFLLRHPNNILNIYVTQCGECRVKWHTRRLFDWSRSDKLDGPKQTRTITVGHRTIDFTDVQRGMIECIGPHVDTLVGINIHTFCSCDATMRPKHKSYVRAHNNCGILTRRSLYNLLLFHWLAFGRRLFSWRV